MADERVGSESVSEFFLSTCQQRRRLKLDDIVVLTAAARAERSVSGAAREVYVCDADVDAIQLLTGSVAEFYIEPMLSCIGDVDIMVHISSQLAVPQEHSPPTQLPGEFHGRVRVYEIIDSEFSGYVYLVMSYLLTEITDDGEYNVVQCRRQYAGHDSGIGTNREGPAIVNWEESNQKSKMVSSQSLFFSRVSVVKRDGNMHAFSVMAATSH